jgi:hypothetical protein
MLKYSLIINILHTIVGNGTYNIHFPNNNIKPDDGIAIAATLIRQTQVCVILLVVCGLFACIERRSVN